MEPDELISMGIQIKKRKFEVDGMAIICPCTCEEIAWVSDQLILLLSSWRQGSDLHNDADFELANTHRNVVAIDEKKSLLWEVTLPDQIKTQDAGYFRELFVIQGRLLVRHEDHNLYDLDPESGGILRSFPQNQLPIGDSVITLDGEVSTVVELEDRVFVGCLGEHDIYAFDSEGNELWRSDPGTRRGHLYTEDGELWEVVAVSKGMDDHYQIDPETGNRIDSWSNYEDTQ
jgi:hypothetical protein